MSAILKQLHIELTNKCNIKCVMCYRQNMTGACGDMDYNLFVRIVNQISQIDSVEKIFLHWRGEPTCYKYLTEAVDFICKKGLKVILFTNGILLNEDIAEYLIKKGIYAIYFSVEEINANEYYKIRGNVQYEYLIENIKKTIAIRDRLKAKTRINISTIIFDENLSKIKEFSETWVNIVDNIEYHIDTRRSNLLIPQEKQCQWPFEALFISWDGLVSACCMDINLTYPLGDGKRDKIIEIFNGNAAKKLRKSLEYGVNIGKCSSCIFFKEKKLSQ